MSTAFCGRILPGLRLSAASWAPGGLLASGSIADDPDPPQSLRPAEGHGSSDHRSVATAPFTRKRVERASLPRYGLTGDASCSARSRSPGRLGARSHPALIHPVLIPLALIPEARPPFVVPPGSAFFRVRFLQHSIVERQVGEPLLEFGLLTLEFLQTLGFRHIHAAELRKPPRRTSAPRCCAAGTARGYSRSALPRSRSQ